MPQLVRRRFWEGEGSNDIDIDRIRRPSLKLNHKGLPTLTAIIEAQLCVTAVMADEKV
jgi:hypothetical protein